MLGLREKGMLASTPSFSEAQRFLSRDSTACMHANHPQIRQPDKRDVRVAPSLMEIADCSHWVDRSDDARGYGTSLEGVISVVRNAGRQLIHLVKLWDEGETCLLFVGEIEEIKAKLSPLLNSLKNQNHEDNDLEFDDDE